MAAVILSEPWCSTIALCGCCFTLPGLPSVRHTKELQSQSPGPESLMRQRRIMGALMISQAEGAMLSCYA